MYTDKYGWNDYYRVITFIGFIDSYPFIYVKPYT